MKPKAREGSPTKELQFELKYCERCGGLWLRPVGGKQIYCVSCGREMGQLPPPSYEAKRVEGARMPRGPRWGADGGFEGDDEDEELDLDTAGGVA
jgi:hypothetical protein